jgi:hypothetical protein
MPSETPGYQTPPDPWSRRIRGLRRFDSTGHGGWTAARGDIAAPWQPQPPEATVEPSKDQPLRYDYETPPQSNASLFSHLLREDADYHAVRLKECGTSTKHLCMRWVATGRTPPLSVHPPWHRNHPTTWLRLLISSFHPSLVSQSSTAHGECRATGWQPDMTGRSHPRITRALRIERDTTTRRQHCSGMHLYDMYIRASLPNPD